MPQGSYTEMLGRLAATEALLRIYRSSSPHLRMRDRELILRFFALVRASPSGLRSPVKARRPRSVTAVPETSSRVSPGAACSGSDPVALCAAK